MTDVYSPGDTTNRTTLTYQIQSERGDYWFTAWTSSAVVEGSPEAEALLVEVHKRLDRLYSFNGVKFRAVCKRWINITETEAVVPMWEDSAFIA